MAIDRYDSYGKPRLHITETGVFMIRDVLTSDGHFAGICENAVYDEFDGETRWRICPEGADFDKLTPFLPIGCVKR